MIFKNKKAFFVSRYTNYKTNTKSYELLDSDFIFDGQSLLKHKNQGFFPCLNAITIGKEHSSQFV